MNVKFKGKDGVYNSADECYGVPSEHMHHNAVSEYFHSLTTTVYNDHDWQDSDSPLFRKSREERKVE